MRIKIGFSPCPNDTFIFGALVNGWIDPMGIEFLPHLADVETLNQWAYEGKLEVTKISFNAFLDLTSQYQLFDSGSALGRNCGPLLISKLPIPLQDLPKCRIAIPGARTTANFLLDYFHPSTLDKKVMAFDQIEDAILHDDVDAGVIIHENRFTYADRGLQLIADLGQHWEAKTGQPIPLGGIIGQRSIPPDLARKINFLIRESLRYARVNTSKVMSYVKQHAQEMDESVMNQHINLYVNHHSETLVNGGKQAIKYFFNQAIGQGRIKSSESIFFAL